MGIAAPWIGTPVQGNVAGSNATTVTVDVSGAPTGEVVFIFGTLGDAQTAALTAPSGWNTAGQNSEGTSGGSSSRSIVYWKVKAAGDASVVIPTWPVTSKPQFVPMCWPGVDPTTPFEGLTWLAHTTGASYDTGTATPTAANRWGVGFFTSRGSTASVAWANSTQTQRVGVINSSSIFVGLAVADTNGAVTQASHFYTATGQTASHGLGAVLYLIPASDTASPRVAGLASANSNSAGYPVNVPGGTVNTDLLIGVVASDFGTAAGNALGTGWTPLTTSSYDGGTNGFHTQLWGRAASSEPASYTVSQDSSDSVAGIIRVTGWDSATGLSGIVQVAPNSADGGKTAPSILDGGAGTLLLTVHAGESSAGGARTWTPPSGMLEQIDRQSTTWTAVEVCSLLAPSNPTGTKAATPSAAVDTGGAVAILIKAAASGGGSTTASPTGIASAEAWGTPSVSATLTASPTGIASAEAWGTPTAAFVTAAAPSGIPTAEAWGTPSVALTLTAAPTGIASAQAFGVPTISATLTVSPTGIPGAEAWGVPGAALGGLTAAPAGIPSAEAFGTPSVALGALAAAPTGITSAEAWGTPSVTVAGGPLPVAPTGIPSAEAWGTPSVTQATPVTAIGIPSAQAFGVPAVSLTLTAAPIGIPSGQAFGVPAVALSLTARPVGIASAQAFGTPTVALGSGTAYNAPERWTAGTRFPVILVGVRSAASARTRAYRFTATTREDQ